MRKCVISLGLIATLFCTSCASNGTSVQNQGLKDLERQVQDLRAQVEVLETKAADGEAYMDSVNAWMARWVFFIYGGGASQDPGENLAKIEKWVKDIRAEIRGYRGRLETLEQFHP